MTGGDANACSGDYQACPSPQDGQVTLAVTDALKAFPQPHM
jgi:hypothetical protein